ncbi:MAG: hypothetical protein LBI82_01495 [Dysgonamonadaceae bacterium]|nr:hypothetical protein [Dysgonamonadaceae bacterium]
MENKKTKGKSIEGLADLFPMKSSSYLEVKDDRNFKKESTKKKLIKKNIVSEQKIPKITIKDEESFNLYFVKPLRDSLKEDSSDKKFEERYNKLLDNIRCISNNSIPKYSVENFQETDHYEKFCEEILERPVFCIFLLLFLLKKEYVRSYFNEIYKKEYEKIKGEKESTINKTTEEITEKIIQKYVDFLNHQLDSANEMFDGVFELAKNVVNHAKRIDDEGEKTAEGGIVIEVITKNALANDRKNSNLWNGYLDSLENKNIVYWNNWNKKDKEKNPPTYLKISIGDDGNKGIIETTLDYMSDKSNFRGLPRETKREDRKGIKKRLDECKSNDDEAQLLFDMYFNGGNSILNRQANQALKGLGIYTFIKYLIENNGFLNAQTIKNNSRSEIIDFSLYGNLAKRHSPLVDSRLFGGSEYHIILPLQKPKIEQEYSLEIETKGAPAKGMYEKMFPLENRELKQQEFNLGPELEKFNFPKYVIKQKGAKKDDIFVFSLKNNRDADGNLLNIDRTMLFRTVFRLFYGVPEEENKPKPEIETIIIRDVPNALVKGLFNLYKVLDNDASHFFYPEKLLLLISEDEDNRECAVITGNSKEECVKINRYIAYRNGYFDIFTWAQRCHEELTEKDNNEIKKQLATYTLFVDDQLIESDILNIDKNGISLFEQRVKIILETSIDSPKDDSVGYKWENTHLKIGSKLHLDDFIYGKKLFQRSRDASGFAYLLSQKILETIKSDIEELKENKKGEKLCYTLVGYGNYSELLVSRTCGFVEFLLKNYGNDFEKERIKCEYVIVKDEEEIKFSRYFKNFKERKDKQTLERLIIIVPISSTLTTSLKIENTFYDELLNQIKKDIKKDKKEEIENNLKIANPSDNKEQLRKKRDEEIKNRAKDELKRRREEKEIDVLNPFHTIVVVGDEVRDAEEKRQTDEQTSKEIEIYFKKKKEKYDVEKKQWINIDADEKKYIEKFSAVDKCWTDFKDKERIIFTENRVAKAKLEEAKRKNQFNIYIQSKWQLPEKCEHCFPDNPIRERPLFVTDKVSVTPTLIFDEPECYQPYGNCRKPYFKFEKDSTEKLPIIDADTIDWVHYEGDGSKHFNYYLHYLDFINKNKGKDNDKDSLKGWANSIRADIFEQEKAFGREEILLITPDKSENGAFTHLINREIFNDKASVIRFDQHSDHYLNFDKFFNDEVKKADKIYFVDNSMFSGKTFLSLDNMLKLLPKGKSINGIFCLNNRMDYDCDKTITKCLNENNDEKDNNKQHLFSFVNLCVPESVTTPCPLCEEKEKLIETIEKDGSIEKKGLIVDASLDCIKQYFFEKELPYYKVVEKEKLIEGELPYKPLEKKHDSTLLKVTLIHFLNKAFADFANKKSFIDSLKTKALSDWTNPKDFDFNSFVENFRDYIRGHQQCNIEDGIINDFKFKANLIKVLSSHSFKKYRGVYIAVFYWVLNDLIIATKTILGDKYNYKGNYDNVTTQTNFDALNKSNDNKKDTDGYIDTANYLRVLIKHAGLLNITYLLHQDFIAAINQLILSFDIEKLESKIKSFEDEDLSRKFKEMRYSFENFRLFCAAHIIRSLYKNEQRAIRFEENINAVLKENEGKDTSFFDLLILENTSIIRQILRNHYETEDLRNNNLDDFHRFMEAAMEKYDENTAFNKLNQIHKIQQKIKEYEKSPETKSNYGKDDKDIKYIMQNIAGIVNCSETNGRGILLYKYQSSKNKTEDSNNEVENYAVVGEYGNEKTLSSYFETQLPNSFATKFLEGINYLTETLYSTEFKTEKTIEYKWTSCAIYKNNDGEWTGQDGKQTINIESKKCKYSEFADIESLNENANRILFIRVSSYHTNKTRKDDEEEEILKGEAVFVFYDNEEENKGKRPDSVHNTRFVHILRNEISEYLKKKYRNDAFRAWVEADKKNKEYKKRHRKNMHGVKAHLDNVAGELIKNKLDGDLEIFAICADLYVGDIHYSLVAENTYSFGAYSYRIENKLPIKFAKNIIKYLTEEKFKRENIIIDLLSFKGKNIYYTNETPFLLFQLVKNIVAHTPSSNREKATIHISAKEEYIVMKNSNITFTKEDAVRINNANDSKEIPYDHISLYAINHYCQKMNDAEDRKKTELIVDTEKNNTFVVKIPMIKL